MGTCISKSKPKFSSPPPTSFPLPPSKDHESCFVQDKLVIISSHPPQVSSPPSPSSASSSFPCTNTTVTSTTSCSSSASSITSCASSSSSSISVSKDKLPSSSSSSSSYSNDYLWSCIKENPHIINQATLDKAHVIPQNFHTRKTEPSPTKSTLLSSKKKQSVVHPTPQKRACSSSTTTTTTPSSPNIVSRQKSFRRDRLPNVERCRHQLITTSTTTTSSVPATKRNSNLDTARYSSSPIRRSKGGNNDTCKGISRIKSPGRKKIWNHDNSHEELGIYKNTNKRNIKETTTHLVIRPSSPQPYNYKRSQDGLGSRKKQIITSTTTTTTHHIYDDDHHHEMDGVREEEAVLSSSCNTDNHQEKEYYLNSAVVSSSTDDIDNPLISLDCFIFL